MCLPCHLVLQMGIKETCLQQSSFGELIYEHSHPVLENHNVHQCIKGSERSFNEGTWLIEGFQDSFEGVGITHRLDGMRCKANCAEGDYSLKCGQGPSRAWWSLGHLGCVDQPGKWGH